MTTKSGGYPSIKRKGNPIGEASKAATAGRPGKVLQPNVVAVEPREREFIPWSNAPHVA